MEVKEKIRETIINLLKLKPQELKDNEKLCEGIGADSTELVELVIALEKAFGVKLSAKEITKFCSVDDIEKMIQSKLSDFSSQLSAKR
ncbi:MAG: acyl carrier protein [Candidatus Omnitrophota bacterium]|nr:acyl carrier protein [Candidatus Omnitrophota bacterium]